MAKTFPTLAKKKKRKKKKKPRFRLSKSQKDKLRGIRSQTETKQTYNFRKQEKKISKAVKQYFPYRGKVI